MNPSLFSMSSNFHSPTYLQPSTPLDPPVLCLALLSTPAAMLAAVGLKWNAEALALLTSRRFHGKNLPSKCLAMGKMIKNYTSIDPKQLRQYQWENRRSKIAVLQFENLRLVLQVGFCTSEVYFCTSKVYFCTSKVYFCTSKVYFESILLYFESILLYFESICFYSKGLMCQSRLLHFEIIVLQFESAVLVLQVGFCTSKLYCCTSKIYFCTSKIYFCTLKS